MITTSSKWKYLYNQIGTSEVELDKVVDHVQAGNPRNEVHNMTIGRLRSIAIPI